MSRAIALFGGSFNPPHRGHGDVVRHLCQLPFNEVWLVPVFEHAFHKNLLPYETRAELCRLLLHDLATEDPPVKKAKVSDIERDIGGVSRTVTTLERLQAQHRDTDFTLVMGADLQAQLPQWKDSAKLQTLAHILFIPRPGFAKPPEKTFTADISASEIRSALRRGHDCSAWLTPSVAKALAKIRFPEETT